MLIRRIGALKSLHHISNCANIMMSTSAHTHVIRQTMLIFSVIVCISCIWMENLMSNKVCKILFEYESSNLWLTCSHSPSPAIQRIRPCRDEVP